MSTLTRKRPSKNTTGLKGNNIPRQNAKAISLEGLSVEQWANMPDTKPRYELINGRLIQKMTAKRKHSRAAGKFAFLCNSWEEKNNLGWNFDPEGTGVFIDSKTGYVPDVMGYAPGTGTDPEESVGSAPFLVAEVLSEGTKKKDRGEKLRGYAKVGVQIYVVIDPEKHTVEVFRLTEGTYSAPETFTESGTWMPSELPGLQLNVADLWMN